MRPVQPGASPVDRAQGPECGSVLDRPRAAWPPGEASVQALEAAADRLLLLAVVLLLAQRLALGPRFLALGQSDLHLGPAVLEVQRQRDDRVALLAGLPLDLVDLGPVEQQFALAPGSVVGTGALGVLRDVDALEPCLAVVDLDEAVDQGRPAGAQRLHLGADEDQSGLVGVLDAVVVPRLAVLRNQLAPLLLGHGRILSGATTGFVRPVVRQTARRTASGRPPCRSASP